ncbi:MAG: ABC transporter permease [Gemmataceae bacterium]|nr:ABC transporter permease [Gemmataceae bacterium]MDW8265518.1 ABC transporter permease [Gemmataceae bacterium]
MRQHLRAIRAATWLGWQIESNWTDPWLFFLYLVLKPLCASLLLWCMFVAARSMSAAVPGELLPFLYVGNACFMIVGGVAFGLSWVIISDREHYQMLKYIWISPLPLRSYLIGRALARSLQSAVGVVLTLAGGWLLLPELRSALTWERLDGRWLVAYLAVGVLMLGAVGMILAGAVLNLGRHSMLLSEGIAGLIYLLSGVVFPVEVLPEWLRPLCFFLPTTYWLEGVRRALMGGTTFGRALEGWSHGDLVSALLLSTALLLVVAHAVFRWNEQRAWRQGRVDQTTGV